MPSIFTFVRAELYRGYQLEQDEQRYVARREKVYTFMKIPREVEKFMSYGFFQCTDAFLFLFTFLPLRYILALWALITRPFLQLFCHNKTYSKRILLPSEIIDVIKGTIILICCFILSYIDTAMMYHLIKSQSVIKLYIFFNMLEVGDRLFSVFGQDIIDALFWTATETKGRKREHFGVLPHFLMAIIYVLMHTCLVLLQATTLNVAINSSNKALLTIMMSNNFVELKSAVFKKFDKNNLFQLSCSDVRERFHLIILLLVVVVQTMKEYSWKEERFWVLLPDCIMVLLAEITVDSLKHAFVTRFNEIPATIYSEYTLSLAYDLAQTKQKHAFAEHSDLVARRMGFIPLPLAVLATRIITQSVKISNYGSAFIFLVAFGCLVTFRILSNIITLGKACDLIDAHQKQRAEAAAIAAVAASTIDPPKVLVSSPAPAPGLSPTPAPTPAPSPRSRSERRRNSLEETETKTKTSIDPPITRSMSIDVSQLNERTTSSTTSKFRSVSHSPPRYARRTLVHRKGIRSRTPPSELELGCQPIFSDSTVSLTSICLNEEIFDEEDSQLLVESLKDEIKTEK